MRRKRARRDAVPASVVPRGGPDARTYARFRRETAALLTHGHRFSREQATHAVAKWDGHLRKLWRSGRPPCVASDQIARLAKDSHARDKTRRRRSRRDDVEGIGSHGYEHHDRFSRLSEGEKERERRERREHHARTLGSQAPGEQGPGWDPNGRRPRRRRTGRDASSPEKGEVYVSRYGNRWEIVDVPRPGRVKVRRLGRKTDGEELVWADTSLRGMSLTGEKKGPLQLSLFGRDASRKRKSPSKKRGKIVRRRCRASTVVQSVVFVVSSTNRWTAKRALAWARTHGFRTPKVDVRGSRISVRQRAPSSVTVVGTRPLKKGIFLVIGCPKRAVSKTTKRKR